MRRYETRNAGETWLAVLDRACRQVNRNTRGVGKYHYAFLTGISANPLIVGFLTDTGCIEKIQVMRLIVSSEDWNRAMEAFGRHPHFHKQLTCRCLYRVYRTQLDTVLDRTLQGNYHIITRWMDDKGDGKSGPKLIVTNDGKTRLPDSGWTEGLRLD